LISVQLLETKKGPQKRASFEHGAEGGTRTPTVLLRQPLKLANLLRGSGLTRILRTDGEQEPATAHARADFFRTNSHMV